MKRSLSITVKLGPLALVLLLINPAIPASAQSGEPQQFEVKIGTIRAPKTCTTSGWYVSYDRTTTVSGYPTSELTRYFVQYVGQDVNLVHFWGSGYDAYVQDYWIQPGPDSLAHVSTSYNISLWTNTYHAVNQEYILYKDQVIWQVRAELDCQKGRVKAFQMTSEAAQGSRASLPAPSPNLVVALKDIKRYDNPYSTSNYVGTIKACQTFTISGIRMPRASISVYATESVTGKEIQLIGGTSRPPIVDVAENYGQPGGQPILSACAGLMKGTKGK